MSYRRPEYPCSIPGCVATATSPHKPCAVHKVWKAGPAPFEGPCTLCRQPITRDELWNYRNNDPSRPVHAACVNRKSKPPKSKPKQPTLF